MFKPDDYKICAHGIDCTGGSINTNSAGNHRVTRLSVAIVIQQMPNKKTVKDVWIHYIIVTCMYRNKYWLVCSQINIELIFSDKYWDENSE